MTEPQLTPAEVVDPTQTEMPQAENPVVDPAAQAEAAAAEMNVDLAAVLKAHEELKAAHSVLADAHATLDDLVSQAHQDSKSFVNQCDREGIGMATVTDHRKRVEKFLARLAKLGRV